MYNTLYTQLALIMLVLVITVCNILCMTAEHAQLMKACQSRAWGDVVNMIRRHYITQHNQTLYNYTNTRESIERKSGEWSERVCTCHAYLGHNPFRKTCPDATTF